MKDEEMAVGWVMNNSKDIINRVSSGESNLFGVAEQAFLAGLKAGRPQWHKCGKLQDKIKALRSSVAREHNLKREEKL